MTIGQLNLLKLERQSGPGDGEMPLRASRKVPPSQHYHYLPHLMITCIGVREGTLLGRRKKLP